MSKLSSLHTLIDPTLKKCKILIVDDHKPNVEILEDLLALLDYSNVQSLTDSSLVLEYIREFKPDLLLLDWIMPKVSGLQLLQALRQDQSPESFFPILVLTADITLETKESALSAGASDFLNKPFNMMEVGLRIKNLLYTKVLFEQVKNEKFLLEIKVSQRTKELEKVNSKLVESNRKAESANVLKSAFIQTISHEIRTPLNIILGFSNLLSDSIQTKEEKEQCSTAINDAGFRLLETLNNYLFIASIVSETTVVLKSTVPLSDFIFNQASLIQNQCRSKQLAFTTQFTDDFLKVVLQTDIKLLDIIFHALSSNAVKFTEKGCITLWGSVENDNVNFGIEDTGCGIDPEMQDYIFGLFTQENNSITRPREGSGLGLSIAKGLTEMLGGSIHVLSNKNKGSNFSIRFSI